MQKSETSLAFQCITLVLLLFIHKFAWADPHIEAPERKPVLLKDLYIGAHSSVTHGIEWLATELDILLAGRRVTRKPNESNVRIENSAYHGEGGKLDTVTHFDLNLRLPNLEKKWELKFTSYDENEENRGLERRQFRTRAKDENYGAALVFFRQLGNIKTTFQPRLQINDPLDMAYYLNFRTEAKFRMYRVDPRVEFFAQPEKGVGVFTSVNFTKTLTPSWVMVLTQEGEYGASKNEFSHTSGVSFGQKILDNAGFNYTLIASAYNRESYHLRHFGFAVAWDHLVNKDYFGYSIAPVWDFNKDYHFHGVVGLRAQVDLIF